VNTIGVSELAQLRCQSIRVNDGILLGKQNTIMSNPHLMIDIHGLFTDRTTTDYQGLQIFTGKGANPSGR
jgi:hypothetical protein